MTSRVRLSKKNRYSLLTITQLFSGASSEAARASLRARKFDGAVSADGLILRAHAASALVSKVVDALAGEKLSKTQYGK